jgi:hypothetical protein
LDRICVQTCVLDAECASGDCKEIVDRDIGWCTFDDRRSDNDPDTNPGTNNDPRSDDPIPDPDNPDPSDPDPDPDPSDPDPDPDPSDPDPDPDPSDPDPDPESCTYPSGPSSTPQYDQIFPNLRWGEAYRNGERIEFSMESFHCDPAFARYSVLAVFIGTEWCGACASYLQQLAPQMQTLEAEGVLMLWAELQDNNYNYISSARANQYLSRYLGASSPGVRIGDGDTQPQAGTLYNSPMVQSFPTAWVIRRGDMRVIADQSRNGGYALDFAQIAREQGGGGVDFGTPPNSCVEESYEANDSVATAGVLTGGEDFTGGVCGTDRDFYRIDVPGTWSLAMTHRHQVGDLDIYVWDSGRNAPLEQSGQKVGSDSATDNELFTYTGPAVVSVHGWEGARAPYRLQLLVD